MIHDIDNLPGAIVFEDNRLVFWSVPPNYNLPEDPTRVYLCSDDTLIYEQFFADFGPLSIACVVRFCRQLTLLMNNPAHANKLIVYHTSSHSHRRSNGAVLMCCFAMIELKRNVVDAYSPFFGCSPPLTAFRDAAFGVCTFPLTVLDCVRGVARALSLGHFTPENFNVDEYLYLDKIENGDVSWIIPQKFIGFSGPLAKKREIEPGVFTMCADDYVKLFHILGVSAVIRFNEPLYDKNIFIKNGINHYDLFYEDGGNPPEGIMQSFINICEQETGAIAVHCKAGLGRTGTNIGAYMMKHYGYTAHEAIAWLRICRPGSVVGPQQAFLLNAQARLWCQGDEMRKIMHSNSSRIPSSSDTLLNKNEETNVNNLSRGENRMNNDLDDTILHNIEKMKVREGAKINDMYSYHQAKMSPKKSGNSSESLRKKNRSPLSKHLPTSSPSSSTSSSLRPPPLAMTSALVSEGSTTNTFKTPEKSKDGFITSPSSGQSQEINGIYSNGLKTANSYRDAPLRVDTSSEMGPIDFPLEMVVTGWGKRSPSRQSRGGGKKYLVDEEGRMIVPKTQSRSGERFKTYDHGLKVLGKQQPLNQSPKPKTKTSGKTSPPSSPL